MSHLRHLSILVDEPEPGHFYWVLHASTEDASVWVDIEARLPSPRGRRPSGRDRCALQERAR